MSDQYAFSCCAPSDFFILRMHKSIYKSCGERPRHRARKRRKPNPRKLKATRRIEYSTALLNCETTGELLVSMYVAVARRFF
jgi:hypothetical protein